MRAMILAAGLGERMRPLTDSTPKPLLVVGGRALICWQISALVRAGITDIVINLCYRGDQIVAALQDGKALGARIRYSYEQGPLETAGGIARALPLLGHDPFVVVNGDVWTDYPYHTLPASPLGEAHLLMVSNPAHHRAGDFYLGQDGFINEVGSGQRLTFSGIGVYRPEMFSDLPAAAYPLAALIRQAILRHGVTGECYQGEWVDVGTPARLHDLDDTLCQLL